LSHEDPTLRVVASEFEIHRGRPQHRPTYDTGRKAHDGTGADLDQDAPRSTGTGQPTNRLVADWTDGGLTVIFEDLA